MSWRTLSREGRVTRHATSAAEQEALARLVERGLRDAEVDGVSADGRFLHAYGAALALARMAIARAGWRVKGPGSHVTTFEAIVPALGSRARKDADYLDSCRLRRNMLAYDAEGLASEEDARELVLVVRRLRGLLGGEAAGSG
jgi:hypothetical protein